MRTGNAGFSNRHQSVTVTVILADGDLRVETALPELLRAAAGGSTHEPGIHLGSAESFNWMALFNCSSIGSRSPS